MTTGRDQDIEETVKVITSGGAGLLNVVKALGEYLTAEEEEMRTKGVEFLSSVLGRCPPEQFNRQSVRVLVNFYCGKLEDTDTLVPAVKGILCLTSLPTFTSPDAVEVVKALFSNVTMKALVQSVRFTVLSVVDSLLARHRDALKNMGSEFVIGYMGLAEGEKDPRNLMLAFAIDRVLLIEFDVEKFIEDFFNITFCYFPITFRPPPDDPYGITPEDLKQTLRSCLNATPAFGPLGIPLFLEKLTAGSPITKRDTLRTLCSCLPVYGPAAAIQNGRKLWNSLRLEIFQPTDTETEEEALKATQVLVRTIYDTEEQRNAPHQEIEGLAKEICEECIKILQEPEKNQGRYATKTLCAFLSTTENICRYTLSMVIPHLTGLFRNPDEVTIRAAIVTVLSEIIAAARDVSSTSTTQEVFLLPYKDEVLGVLVVGLKNPSSSGPAIDGLKSMVSTRGLLSDEELGYIVHNVNELLDSVGGSADESTDALLELLVSISSHSPRHVEETTLPLLFSSLPDSASPREADSERAKYWRTLTSLKKLCSQSALFETLVIRLSTKLDFICEQGAAPTTDLEPTAAYAHALLHTLADVLTSKVKDDHPDVPKYIERLAPRLYNLFIYSALKSDGSASVATDPRLIKVAGRVITLILQATSAQKQEPFIVGLYAAYLQSEVTRLASGAQKITPDQLFVPFSPGAPLAQKNLVHLFSTGVVAARKEVEIPVPNPSEFLGTLLMWSVHSADNSLQRDSAWHIIASIVNKRPEDVSLFLTGSLETFWPNEIASSNASVTTRRFAINGWIWLSKALWLRGHPLSTQYVDRLFDLFSDATVSWDAARAIGMIGGSDDILKKPNHSVLKVLYAQKLCTRLLPRIIEGAKITANPGQQTAHLVALASLIKSVPQTTYIHEISALMPLLLRGLDLPDFDIRADVIDTLYVATEGQSSKPTIVSEHATTLVTIMLRNSVAQEMPSIRVRTAALKYLALLPNVIRYDILHPQKATVLRELAKALDDPKRGVRKEAVEARSNW
ncbi:hypothetical protein JAAARDRAFT_190123 [Jaapia argillacea MUCL 33604]|uniref:MMS19 nucleotide excision repair protein n=1 Tax=Jaapia argillacea MUCL 33604 TaxID=933084 RepID=A0A067QFF9_9AGAM|nr:hypothetical protein JAAARDRAFT_190123 [Jaapia argillacea MUCL 33604]